VGEHLRQHERVTEADRLVQERLRAFHRAGVAPAFTHLVAGLARRAGQQS